MNSSSTTEVFDVAIIGAGVTGLAARIRFKQERVSSVTLEKSRGLGGRLATRRGDQWLADLGAQSVSGQSKEWLEFIDAGASGFHRASDPAGAEPRNMTHPRGMSAFAKSLAQAGAFDGAAVHLQSRVTRVAVSPSSSAIWEAHCESGAVFLARSVLFTAPLPQAQALLEASGLVGSSASQAIITQTPYSSCWVGVYQMSRPLPERIPAVLMDPTPELAGVFDQTRKGVATALPTLVVHASPEASRELWEEDDARTSERIADATQRLFMDRFSYAAELTALSTHRWRYRTPLAAHPERFFEVHAASSDASWPMFILAGDAFGEASVDGAFASGTAAAEFLAGRIRGASR